MSNLKLALNTLSFQDWPPEKLVSLCQENQLTGIELRLGLSDWSKQAMTDEEIADFLEVLKAHGMHIINLGTSVCVNHYDKAALSALQRDFQFARRIHANALRIMLGSFRTRWSETGKVFDYEGICNWVKEADKMAGEYGCEIWIETHYEFAPGKLLHKLFSDCRPANCKIIWDVMHPLEQREALEDTYSYVKQYLVHVHIKDGEPWPDEDLANWKYTAIGEGAIPLRSFVRMLLSNGYDGYFSLEWEPMWHEEIRGEGCEREQVIQKFSSFMKEINKSQENESSKSQENKSSKSQENENGF